MTQSLSELPTAHLRNAFEVMRALTMHVQPDVLPSKRASIMAMREHEPDMTALLRIQPLISIGAHLDISSTLLLGGRLIHLVDPYFIDPFMINKMIEVIEGIIGERVRATISGDLVFDFDFGYGAEEVRVSCIGRYLAPTIDPSRMLTAHQVAMERTARLYDQDNEEYYHPTDGVLPYVPPAQIGFLHAYNPMGAHFDRSPEILDCVAPGGYVFLNRGLIGLMPHLDNEEDPCAWDVQDICWQYDRYTDFRFVPLRIPNAHPLGYSFLRKKGS